MDSSHDSSMAGVHGVQQYSGFDAADFAENDAIGAMA